MVNELRAILGLFEEDDDPQGCIGYKINDYPDMDIFKIDWFLFKEGKEPYFANQSLQQTIRYLKDIVTEENIKSAEELIHRFRKQAVRLTNLLRPFLNKP